MAESAAYGGKMPSSGPQEPQAVANLGNLCHPVLQKLHAAVMCEEITLQAVSIPNFGHKLGIFANYNFIILYPSLARPLCELHYLI